MTKNAFISIVEKANLIERSRKAQYRPCRFHPESLKDEWMEQYRQFFEGSFDRLDEYLQELQNDKENNDDNE